MTTSLTTRHFSGLLPANEVNARGTPKVPRLSPGTYRLGGPSSSASRFSTSATSLVPVSPAASSSAMNANGLDRWEYCTATVAMLPLWRYSTGGTICSLIQPVPVGITISYAASPEAPQVSNSWMANSSLSAMLEAP